MQLLGQTLPDSTIPSLWQFRPLLRLTRESIQIIRQMSDALEICLLCLFVDKEDILQDLQSHKEDTDFQFTSWKK